MNLFDEPILLTPCGLRAAQERNNPLRQAWMMFNDWSDFPYVWRVKSRLPERKGQPCRVLIRSKMNSCLVEFEDGYKVVTSRNYVRKR